MKAALVTAPGVLEVQDIPMPRPGPYDCLVKIAACAVCTGTDHAILNDHFPSRAAYPLVLGHESAGTIIELGREVRNYTLGQTVTRAGAILAGESAFGLNSSWGGYAEYGLVRDARAAEASRISSHHLLASSRSPLPLDVDMISASLSVNQREIISVASRFQLGPGSRLAVLGTGYNGLLFSLLSKHFGASRVAVLGNPKLAGRALGRYAADAFVDYHAGDARQQTLQALGGAPTHVIDAVGSHASLALAETLLEQGTAFGCYGMANRGQTGATLQRLAQGRTALNMTTDEASFVQEWYELWRAGFFQNPGMVDEIMPLNEIRAAFERVNRREALKIVITL